MLLGLNLISYAIVYITRNNTENAPVFPLSEIQSIDLLCQGLERSPCFFGEKRSSPVSCHAIELGIGESLAA
jgi:hypothetical protein